MTGYVWQYDALIVGGFMALCVLGLIISSRFEKSKPAPRGATRI